MAATTSITKTAARKGRSTSARKPVRGANFQSKSQRKAARKRMVRGSVRGAVSNRVADARIAAQERAAFYRGLRELKLRRRRLATEFARLATMVTGLQRDAGRVEVRYPDVDPGLVDEAISIIKRANVSTSVAAEDMYTFSRRRVYFTEAGSVA